MAVCQNTSSILELYIFDMNYHDNDMCKSACIPLDICKSEVYLKFNCKCCLTLTE